MSLLVVMGSGETAPTMVKLHRQVLEQTDRSTGERGPGTAVMLDTPFGFQVNADDLVARTRTYFAESVGRDIQVASWRRRDAGVVEQEKALTALHHATWAFAGPGSPTYALRQWVGTALPEALLDVAARGGTLVVGSAAACTLGTHAVPVYEIYKVGQEAHWEPGLDLLGRLTDLRAAVVPHYDNREGGGYDTRFCYLGEDRLAVMEGMLPDDVGVLGVDEHTGLVVDLAARVARVSGSGVVTVRRRGRATTFPSGAEVDLDRLRGLLRGEADAGPAAPGPAALHRAGVLASGTGDAPSSPGTTGVAGDGATHPAGPPSLRGEAAAARERFDTAEAGRDVEGCVGAVLDLESAISLWSADTAQNDDTDFARRVLRALVVRLGELARDGVRDPRELLSPFVETLLALRADARATKDFATSDLVRDRLSDAGVEVRDTTDGPRWDLVSDAAGHDVGGA